MDLKLLYAIALTILPITELRVGLPMAIAFAIENSVPIAFVFILIVLVNILLIFGIFFFLDHVHHILIKVKIYEKLFNAYLRRFQKKVDKFERKSGTGEFVALALFVAVPLPGTGAWSGCLLAWLIGLDRKKSIWAISVGVTIAGVLILLGSLGFINFFL